MHTPAQQLVRYTLGELDSPGAARVRRHAAQCAECGDQLAALILLRTDDVDQAAPLAVAPARGATRRFASGLAAAAATLLVGVAAWALLAPGEAGWERAADVANGALLQETAEDLDLVFGVDVSGATVDATASDTEQIGRALALVRSGDLAGAAGALSDFDTRWDRFGTGLLGMTEFVRGADRATAVLEFYVAEHASGHLVRGDSRSPEDVVLFFLAQARFAAGDAGGAREALAWIAPDSGIRAEAARWAERALGERRALPAIDD
jgi:hypothetical protein